MICARHAREETAETVARARSWEAQGEANRLARCVANGTAPESTAYAKAGGVCDAPSGAAHPLPLGNNTDLVAGVVVATTCESPLDLPVSLPPPATVKAWYLRSYAREALTRAGVCGRSRGAVNGRVLVNTNPLRLRWCGARVQRKADGVSVYARPDRPYGRIGGVCLCGQSIACPVCAPRVAAFRAAEISTGFERALNAGWEARLVTHTMPHHRGFSLWGEMVTFSTAWAHQAHSANAKDMRRESLGNVVGREMTFGGDWHYHHHSLRFDRPGTFDEGMHQGTWMRALQSVGRWSEAAEMRGFHVGAVGTESGARYVAKMATSVEASGRSVGSEIASSVTKGRNLMTLLSAAAQGDDYAEGVWVRGVVDVTSRKVSSVRWSRGFRGKVGLANERTDAEVAADEVLASDELLGGLTAMQWRGVLHAKAEFVLCCAANRGRDAVNDFLAGLSLGQLDDLPAGGRGVDEEESAVSEN